MTTAAAAPDLLEAIVAATRRAVEHRQSIVGIADLERRASRGSARGAAFRAELSRANRVNIIAECKRRSPSRGVLQRDYDPVRMAIAYEQGGAAAISVLTEPTFFDGSIAHLEAVRAAVALPVLRKDFVVDAYQIVEARAHGADAILLIVAALTDAELTTLLHVAHEHQLAALVEVHDVNELERAVGAGAAIIGVNNRNLRTLQVDTSASEAIARRLPRDVVAVSESGLRTADDLKALRALGYSAFLIGETLMTAARPDASLRSLIDTP